MDPPELPGAVSTAADIGEVLAARGIEPELRGAPVGDHDAAIGEAEDIGHAMELVPGIAVPVTDDEARGFG